MSVLTIRVLGDPVLRDDTVPITGMTSELRTLVDDMFDTMHAAQGIGLAAPQVGRRERLAVIEIEGQRVVLVNPEIVHTSGKSKREEGCLSIPDVFAHVERPGLVRVRALDVDFKPFEIEAGDLMGTCLQHEIDHLHGKMFLDRLSLLKRRRALAEWDEIKAEYPDFRRVLSPGDLQAHPSREDESL
ncbi:MAG: peptide deformylase [Gemmatimonadaceae bacterium]|nr:peptide deformylase [Gemmatimonadaceae bacterium]